MVFKVDRTPELPNTARNLLLTKSKEAVKVLSGPDVGPAAARLARAIRNTAEGINSQNPLQMLRITAVVQAPFAIRNIAQSSIEIYRGDPEKVDNALTIAAETGTLANVIAATAEALGELGVTAQSVAWISPLYITGAVLSGVEIVRDVKNIYETHKVSKIVFQKDKNTASGFTRTVSTIKGKHLNNKKFISKHFGVKGDKLIENLEKVDKHVQQLDKGPLKWKGDIQAAEVSKLAEKRMKVQKWSRVYNILTSIINIIGFAILFSPAAPVGCILIGLSSLMSVAQIVFLKKINRQFEEAIHKATPEGNVIVPM